MKQETKCIQAGYEPGKDFVLAIDAACKKLGGWRLWQCELFVTLEPCPMCAGAMLMAEIDQCIFGAFDARQGCCGSI